MITQAIENIASISEENSASVEEVSASAEEMSAQVTQVTGSARALADTAQTLRETVNQFKLHKENLEETLSVIETFRKAHLTWVERVENMARGGKVVLIEEVPDHHHCALGRWYDGRGQREWGKHDSFAPINGPHEAFHKALRECVLAYKQQNKSAFEQNLSALKRHSHDCENAILNLKKQISNSRKA